MLLLSTRLEKSIKRIKTHNCPCTLHRFCSGSCTSLWQWTYTTKKKIKRHNTVSFVIDIRHQALDACNCLSSAWNPRPRRPRRPAGLDLWACQWQTCWIGGCCYVNDTFIADDDATATSSSPTAHTGLYLLIPSLSLCSFKGEHPKVRAAAKSRRHSHRVAVWS